MQGYPESSTELGEAIDLREYLRPLWRGKWLIALCAVVVGAIAFVLYPTGKPVYRSQAQVLVGEGLVSARGASGQASNVNLETEQSIITSTAVAEPAREQLDTELSTAQLLAMVSVAVPRGSEVLSITFSAARPKLAQEGAQAFAEAYVSFRQQRLEDSVESSVDELTKRLDDLRARLDEANLLVAQTDPGSSEQNAAVASRDVLAAEVRTVNDQLLELGSVRVDPGTLVGEATEPQRPQSAPEDERRLAALAGALAGAAVGIVIAYARHGFDDRIRSHDELARHLGAPTLGAIAKWSRRSDRTGAPLLASQSDDAAVEDHRALRASFLTAADRHDGGFAVLVTAAGPGEGKSSVASNLSISLARSGHDVLLVDADLRRPRLERLFAVREAPGFSELLFGDLGPQDVIVKSDIAGVRLIPSGVISDAALDAVAADDLARVITRLRACASIVIIDCAPLIVADALNLAPVVDGVLFVAEAGSPRAAVARAREQIDQTGAHLIGGVLTKFDPRKAHHDSALYVQRYRQRQRYAPSGDSTRSERRQRDERDRMQPAEMRHSDEGPVAPASSVTSGVVRPSDTSHQ